MQHESRKRPHADNIDDFSSSKKRIMDNSSPQLNGVHHNSDEPTFDNLEVPCFLYSTFSSCFIVASLAIQEGGHIQTNALLLA